jgi:hypothetical protein
MPSTSIAIASSSNAMSTVALIESQNAKKTACIGLINNYKQTSNVVEMRAYSECVNIVYPVEEVNMPAAKHIVASGLICMLIGAIIMGVREKEFSYAVAGAIAGLSIWFALVLLIGATVFAFS